MRSDIAEGGAGGRDEADAQRCAYVIETAEGNRQACFCNAACRRGSAYCPEHHARCHLSGGSAAEQRQLRRIEALADAAGGKRVRRGREPSVLMLRRLERAARSALLRLDCSCIVLKEAGDAAKG